MTGARPALVELEPRYAWARETRQDTATQTARVEDAKAAQARADAAEEVYRRALAQPALDAAAAEERERERMEARQQRLLARQREAQAVAQRGAEGTSSVASRPWDNLRVRSSLVRRDRTAAAASAKSRATRWHGARAGPRQSAPSMFHSRQSQAELVDQLAQEIESRVRPDATVEFALRVPLPTADQWRPPRSFITREGTDGDPFVWIAARKASTAPAMHNRQSQRASMSTGEKRDRREMGLVMGRHRACMDELLKLARRAQRRAYWAEMMAPFSVSEKTIESQQVKKDRARAVGDDEHGLDVRTTSSQVVVVSSDMLTGDALLRAATTPFSALQGGEAALEARARTEAAKRNRQRHRYLRKETWQKYADLGTADVDARGRQVVESSAHERVLDGMKAENTEPGETDIWKRHQTSSMLFQRRAGVYYRDTAETPAGSASDSVVLPSSNAQEDHHESCKNEAVVEQQDAGADLDGLYALAPEVASVLPGRSTVNTKVAAQFECEGKVTQGLRSLLDDITQMQMNNIRAAELHCSSEAPRMQPTPPQQTDHGRYLDTADVWKQESICRDRHPAETSNSSSQGHNSAFAVAYQHSQQGEQNRSRRLSHRLRSAQRVRTQREKQLLASRAAADMVVRACG